MHTSLAATGCGCRICLAQRALLRRMERDVIADLVRYRIDDRVPDQWLEAGVARGDIQRIAEYGITWTERVHVGTANGSLDGVKAALSPRLQGAFTRDNGIYEFFFGTNLAYIGMTGGNLRKRVLDHFSSAKKFTLNSFGKGPRLPTECDCFEMMLSMVCSNRLWSEITVRCADATQITLPRGAKLDFDMKGLHALELLLQDTHRSCLRATEAAFKQALVRKGLPTAICAKLTLYRKDQYRFEDT